MKRLLQAASAAFFMSACTGLAPAGTEGGPTCPSPWVEAAPMMDAARAAGWSFVWLQGEEAANLLAFVNALEPPTDWTAGRVGWGYGGNPARGSVVLIEGACLWMHEPIPAPALSRLLREAQGAPA